MFNTEIKELTPKTKPAEPCGMTIGVFPKPEPEPDVTPEEDTTNES